MTNAAAPFGSAKRLRIELCVYVRKFFHKNIAKVVDFSKKIHHFSI